MNGGVPLAESSGDRHWSKQKEEAGRRRMALFFFFVKLFPPLFLGIVSYPVGFCYFLFSKKGRAASESFFRRIAKYTERRSTERRSAKRFSVRCAALKHITAFALTLVEKAEAWTGRIPFKRIHFEDDDIVNLVAELEKGKGAALICSHLGNAELLRALADHRRTGVSREVPVTSVVDFETTPFFNKLLSSLNPRSSLKIISAASIDPGSIIILKEETEQGGLAVIAGDRTSAGLQKSGAGELRRSGGVWKLPFLGEDAAFPQGPFLLAALLEAPVYAVFALRRKDLSPLPDYTMHVHFLGNAEKGASLSRKERQGLAKDWARRYAALLEGYCLQHPYQWYNFYDFWA